MTNLGQWGEVIAADYLRDRGYRVLERNWRVVEGEIDLIAETEDTLVFIEVKTRKSVRFGSPEHAVDGRKQLRLQRAAWRYLESIDRLQANWRIDVIAIEQADDGRLGRIDHYVNAVDSAEDLHSS